MKKIYISGPISGMPDGNRAAFEAAAIALRERYPEVQIVNPCDNGLLHDSTWVEHMRANIKILVDCDAICMLPGWRDSAEGNTEYGIACDLWMDRMTLERWLE